MLNLFSAARACARMVRLVLHLLAGRRTIRRRFPSWSGAERERAVEQWARQALVICGVELAERGARAPAHGPLMIVANHISWLDILVLHAWRHMRFVAKAEVHHWPLVGAMATAAGTLYIERESRRDALRVVHHLATCLEAGDIAAVFPEGTTSDGSVLLPFHANLLQAALTARAPVQCIALRYEDAATDALSTAPAYVGEQSLAASVWRLLNAAPIRAVVQADTPLTPAEGCKRRELASQLHETVAALQSRAAGTDAAADEVRRARDPIAPSEHHP
ncbi:MAG TPA: lysophospholipid acyltransferase family protein [Burkholderiaceae bacterium]|nr:lysophospholipid acyltransferase family protein [Burkholderiaceae bacterium]